MNVQDSRILIKRSTVTGVVPTVPASNDHTDGTWLSTDIYKGEFFINQVDSRVWMRDDSGIVEITGGGVSSVFGRAGAVVAVLGDYTTAQVTEDTNLYFTNARVDSRVQAYTGDVTVSGTAFSIGASKVTNSMLAGSIAYSKLSLTGAILNSDLAGSIAYSKLSLTGSIVNGDLAGAVSVAKGGNGLTTVAAGSIIGYNTLDTASAITSTSGLKVLQNNAGTISWSTIGVTSFLDNAFTLQDNGDATKQLQFELSGISTGTTRTLTVPNVSDTLAVLGTAQTFSAKQTFTAATTEMTALTLFDTTYKTALDVTTSNLRLGNGFSALVLGPATMQRSGSFALNVGSLDLNGIGAASLGIKVNLTFTGTTTGDVYSYWASGSWTRANTAATYYGLNIITAISQSGTSVGDISFINVAPTSISFVTTNNLYGIRSQIASGTSRWNIYADGTANNYLAGNTGVGSVAAATSILSLGASTTAKSSLNIPSGTAPSSPVNGDIWSDGADIKVRLGGTTYTLTKV